ncbi:hypothetical protein [Vibrio aestuarianus]|uniref:hypothetical protein n=1 Tax=Vibrio aestuarianus TaxID=28171 RepID=UPI00237C84E6|nr:hypothetical protein [Vibrio aestuarianus]MDE1263915.1 hypothetical protein [Vibrio aestuarianus]MDE1295843.1 hypothetical protein [Vibrio aestuarianus]
MYTASSIQQLINELAQDSRTNNKVHMGKLDKTIKKLKNAPRNQNAEKIGNCIRDIKEILSKQNSRKFDKKNKKINCIENIARRLNNPNPVSTNPKLCIIQKEEGSVVIIAGQEFKEDMFTGEMGLGRYAHRFPGSPLAADFGRAYRHFNNPTRRGN